MAGGMVNILVLLFTLVLAATAAEPECTNNPDDKTSSCPDTVAMLQAGVKVHNLLHEDDTEEAADEEDATDEDASEEAAEDEEAMDEEDEGMEEEGVLAATATYPECIAFNERRRSVCNRQAKFNRGLGGRRREALAPNMPPVAGAASAPNMPPVAGAAAAPNMPPVAGAASAPNMPPVAGAAAAPAPVGVGARMYQDTYCEDNGWIEDHYDDNTHQTLAECSALCDSQPNCAYFLFGIDQRTAMNRCTTQQRCEIRRAYGQGGTTAIYSRARAPVAVGVGARMYQDTYCEDNGNIEDHYDDNTHQTLAECSALCDSQPNCAYFLFGIDQRTAMNRCTTQQRCETRRAYGQGGTTAIYSRARAH